MAYSTIAQVRLVHERIPTDLEAAAQAVEDSAVEAFIADADAVIDLYIGTQNTLPLVTVPHIVQVMSKNLATCYYLRRVFGSQVEEYHEFIKVYCEEPMEWLEDIKDGKMKLDSLAQPSNVDSNTKGKVKIFDLGHVYSQQYHPTVDDERYGEDE